MVGSRGKGYLVFAIVTALPVAGAIVAIVLWLSPRWGINLPEWGFILLMVAYAAYTGRLCSSLG